MQDKTITPVDDRVRGWARIGREQEGTSPYRAELATLLMLLRRAPVDADVAVLLDCKSEITEIGKWLSEGSRAALAAPSARARAKYDETKLRIFLVASCCLNILPCRCHGR